MIAGVIFALSTKGKKEEKRQEKKTGAFFSPNASGALHTHSSRHGPAVCVIPFDLRHSKMTQKCRHILFCFWIG